MTLTAQDLVANAKRHIREIGLPAAQARLGQIPVLDVREPAEFAAGHLPGAINIPRGVLEFKIGEQPAFAARDAAILVYCQTGGRAALSVIALQQLGYTQAISLAGGFKAWTEAGLLVAV